MTERALPDAKKRRRPPLEAKRPRPQAMKPVKGVGRHGNRGYCEVCGHTTGRCVCPDDEVWTDDDTGPMGF